MASEDVFVDSSMWKALIDPADDFYAKAAEIWNSFRLRQVCLFTTNYILDESFTLIRKRCGIKSAILLRDRLVSSQNNVKIVRVTIADEKNAWNWFLKDWSNLSFTDCVSFAVMKRLGLTHTATFDQHFGKAGFTVEN